MQRRSFFGAVFSGLGSAANAQAPKAKSGGIPTRTLGRTGQKLTIIGMGGARFRLIPFEEGPPLVRRAYDLGINYFDMARGYAAKGASGHAEEAYGAAIPPFRKNIFLTTKSGRRTRKEAEADLDASLKLLKTDYVDLWQIHGVNRPEDIERLLAPNGALEAFEAAKKAGKCRFIGFTGHADPAVNLALLRQYDKFDTVFMPLHVADTVYKSFEKGTLPTAAERGMGIFAMKVLAHAHNLRGFTLQECLSYVLSLPITAAALGFATMGQLEDDVRIAQAFKPLSKAEMDALRERAASDRFDITNGPTLEYWKRNT